MTQATREALANVARILHDAGWDQEDDMSRPATRTMAASGMHVGMVTSVVDPENKGRIEVQLPSGTRQWAQLLVNQVQHGQLFFLPEINEHVLIAVGQDENPQIIVLGTVLDESAARRVKVVGPSEAGVQPSGLRGTVTDY
jgi:hypothetical protein